MESEPIEYPVRINRYLYLKGYCSRRKADTLIADGKVFINGAVAELGQKVQATDTVSFDKVVRDLPSQYRYYLYYKPRGIVSHNPQRDEKSVDDVSGLGKKVFPVGRLDKESYGLMFLTDDGRVVNRLLSPTFGHEREYAVRVDKRITESALNRMRKGVRIEDYMTKPAEIRRVNDTTFRIILKEGKKHQIRRMCAALGYAVRDLKRTRMMFLKIGQLKENEHRPLTAREQTILFTELGMS